MLNETQFTQFYRETSSQLAAYLQRISGDKSLTADIVQESYIKFLKSAPNSLTERQRKTYLYQIATRAYYDTQRRQKRWLRLFTREGPVFNKRGGETELSDVSASSDPAVAMQLSMDFSKAFARLQSRERSLLWLAYAEHYEHAEIALILGVAAKSVKVLLFRAKNELRSVLREMGINSIEEV